MDGTRRPDIDWLRVGATYLLFVFHVGKVFDPAPFYHIRNADLSFTMLVVCGFIGLWHMPLFFLLAGWSAATSLDRRGSRGFVAERVRRLAIPLLAGCVLLAPARSGMASFRTRSTTKRRFPRVRRDATADHPASRKKSGMCQRPMKPQRTSIVKDRSALRM